jgi:hypothetical protein
MAENVLKIGVSIESLQEAILSLEVSEKHKLWTILEADLFADEIDSPEHTAEIQAARTDYAEGDYMTFDQYRNQRITRSA